MKRLLFSTAALILILFTTTLSALAQTGRIAGTVIHGGAVEGVSVKLTGSASGVSTTDSSGAFNFVSLPAGCYELQAFPPVGGTYQISEQIDLNLSPGQQRTGVIIALEDPAYTVTGTVSQGVTPLVGVSVAFSNEKNIYLQTSTNPSGVYTFTNLPPGKAIVSVLPYGTLGVSRSDGRTAGYSDDGRLRSRPRGPCHREAGERPKPAFGGCLGGLPRAS